MLYSYCSVSQTTEHGGPIDGRHETYVTSKYVLVSRPTLCVLLNKYMLLTHDRVCLVTADKCKTLLEVSYFDIVLYFCFNIPSLRHTFRLGDGRAGETLEFGRWEGRQLERGGQIETNVSTDREILNILRHHIENDVSTT